MIHLFQQQFNTSILSFYTWVGVVLFILTLAGLNLVMREAAAWYYTHADIERFYIPGPMIAEDACVGSLNHLVTSKRIVRSTDVGWPAEVTKELFRIEDGTFIKVHEERTQPFVEVSGNGHSQRYQSLPEGLPIGNYQWHLAVILSLKGHDRSDIPLIKSNIFKILVCE